MTTATLARPRLRPATKLLTAEELAGLPEELDGQAVKYELYDGELIIMAPPGGEHGRRQAKITRFLDTDAESIGLGIAFSEVGIILRRNPDRVVGADGAFVLKRSLPVNYSPSGYLLTIPEIVIEVRSKNDTLSEIKSKSDEYFEAGVITVWLIDPLKKTVTLTRTSGEETTFGLGDHLLCEDLLPAFSVLVDKLFV